MATDPVCGMTSDDKSAYGNTYAGQVYVFGCSDCKAKFDKEPGRYTATGGGEFQQGRRP